MAQSSISEKDVAAFSTKLDQWGKTLNPKERALLHALLKTAETAMPEGKELSSSELQGVAGGVSGLTFQKDKVVGLFRSLNKSSLLKNTQWAE